jgi:hypothetical protein
MTPSRFNRMNHIQTSPKPPSLMPVWYAAIMYVILLATLGRVIWVHYHPESAKGGEVIQSVNSKNK